MSGKPRRKIKMAFFKNIFGMFFNLFKKLKRLHLGLYIIFSLMILFGSVTSYFFEKYSLIDEKLLHTEIGNINAAATKGERYYIPDSERKLIFKPLDISSKAENGSYHNKEDYPKAGPVAGRTGGISKFYFIFLLLWLLPLYRYYFSRGKRNTAAVEWRIMHLPLIIFILCWIIAAQHFLVSIHDYSLLYGRAGIRVGLIFLVSSVLMGAFTSYLNLELTGLYIRRFISRPFFRENDLYSPRKGFAVSLTMRYALMIFSLAIVPLLFCVYVPVLANMDIFMKFASCNSEKMFMKVISDNTRVFLPIIVVVVLVIIILFFQLLSILLYRMNVQKPVSSLVRRMKKVAAGDFNCKTSVLYSDEVGQLKGHFNMMLDGLVERDKIKDTFGRYVSMEIAEKIMKSGKVNLAGEEIQATVLFADIRGFTPFSETMPPVKLISFLNEYFSYITAPITENKGVINKFIGDAVMAVFSPVFGVEDHVEAALRSAIGMHAALKEFNAGGHYPEINFGVGIHSGRLVAGNVGTSERLEYTVIGDTVNVASRIESQTKITGTQILISEAVMSGVDKNKFSGVEFIKCPPVLMKGKSVPMVLYKVRADKI